MIKNLFSRSGNYNPSKEYLEKRRPAIIAHHYDYNNEDLFKELIKYPKKPEDEVLLKSALQNNDFLSSLLQRRRLEKVVDSMYPQEVVQNQIIIKEDTIGSHLYVSAKGTFEIIQKDEIINTFGDVRVFGELALLYGAKRLATIKAKTNGKIWVLDQVIFKHLMVRSDIEEHNEMMSFLKNVPKFNAVNNEILEEVADLLRLEFFVTGTPIVKEGDKGDKFYIIRAGSVTVSKQHKGKIDNLHKSDFFGELALLKEDVRQATVTSDAPGTECLTLTHKEFINHFGEISDFRNINYQPHYKPIEGVMEYADLKVEDLDILSTLGMGGFGRVEFVQHNTKKELVFALKCMKKQVIFMEKQQEHVFNEKHMHLACNSKFVVRLYRTYRDNKYLYLLLEPCLGGDLWNLLHRQKNKRFDEVDARFYAGCVVEALAYLHERGIIYRDLKPENLLIDSKGYLKLTDFGFAKELQQSKKTYTFAGTPEYVSPEMILNKGHDKAVDYWALGIFIFEMLTGRTPFKTNDKSYMKTYKMILRGIDLVIFPGYVSSKAKSIIKKMCKNTPSERLGCQKGGVGDIKTHDWFVTLNWDKLSEGAILAPFKPELKNATDMQYFDEIPKNLDIPPDETSGWDEDF